MIRPVPCHALAGARSCPGQSASSALVSPGNGSGARRTDVRRVRDLLRKCQQPGVSTAPFVKQLGAVTGRELGAGPKGGDWDAWPADLRVREFPGPAAASPLGVTGARP
jgi:protein gp37